MTKAKRTKDAGTLMAESKFQQVPNIIINEVAAGVLQPVDSIVYMVLLNFTRGKPFCFPSLETIGSLSGYKPRSISRSLDRLEERGHIFRRGNSKVGTRKTYVFTRVNQNKVIDGRANKDQREATWGFPGTLPDEDSATAPEEDLGSIGSDPEPDIPEDQGDEEPSENNEWF